MESSVWSAPLLSTEFWLLQQLFSVPWAALGSAFGPRLFPALWSTTAGPDPPYLQTANPAENAVKSAAIGLKIA